MFEMRGIDKRFGAVEALRNASLSVKSGEIRALLGSNGSGKSTMVKALAGLVNPDGGEIVVNGKTVQISSGLDARKLGIATAFQDLSLVQTMTVLDNIMLGNEMVEKSGIISRGKALAEVTRLLERFGLEFDPDLFVQTLMPSMQSMLEVAKATLWKPRLLLLDEVTASLHHNEIEILFDILRELKQQGVAIIYVTHRMKEIFEICDTATIMRSGMTVAECCLKDLTLDDIVFHMTGKRPDASSKAHGDNEAQSLGELVLNVENLKLAPKVLDISLKAYKGQIVGIAGLEGQGQPEFIRSVLGAAVHEDGKIEYLGKEVKFRSPGDAIKNNIGFISGERSREAMFPARSAAENIFAGNAVKGKLFSFLPVRKVQSFAKKAMLEYNIVASSPKDPASSLSGGNQQKLAIVRWLALKPTLLLLDDPTKGVDVHSRREIHDILRECARQGMTVILSSSESEELLDVADCIYVFYDGQVSGCLSGSDMTHERLVATMMGMTADKSAKRGELS